MGIAAGDKAFDGSIPQLYERYLVPLIFEPYARDMASRLARRPPGRILEIAAGTGVLTRALALALPPACAIVATDLNPPMIEHAAKVGTARPVEWRQADAMQLYQDADKALTQAHAMAPNLGQGANSALTDAAVLADALRQAPDLATALAAYDQRRRKAVRRVADQSARLGALAERTHPVARWLRDRLLMPLAARLAGERAVAETLQESPRALAAMCGA